MIRCWLRAYRRRRWTRQKVDQAVRRLKGRRPGRRAVKLAAGLLAVGLLAGAGDREGIRSALENHGFRLVSREKSCHVEWVPLPEGEETPQEVYGVRICPERLEVQFYHETQELSGSKK